MITRIHKPKGQLPGLVATIIVKIRVVRELFLLMEYMGASRSVARKALAAGGQSILPVSVAKKNPS